MKYINRCRRMIPVCIVGIIYLIAFYFLENRDVPIHIIESRIDRIIPFCEYFIIPYLLWFVYVAGTVIYFACINRNHDEYRSLCISLLTGMIVFLIISYIYPNGQNLRPVLEGDNIFQRMVMNLYNTDTSTNILPSLHVFYSVVCCIALVRNDKVRQYPWMMAATYTLTISIILATMVLKQHSILDVIMALLMNGVCFYLFYDEAFMEYKVSRVEEFSSRHKRKGVEL